MLLGCWGATQWRADAQAKLVTLLKGFLVHQHRFDLPHPAIPAIVTSTSAFGNCCCWLFAFLLTASRRSRVPGALYVLKHKCSLPWGMCLKTTRTDFFIAQNGIEAGLGSGSMQRRHGHSTALIAGIMLLLCFFFFSFLYFFFCFMLFGIIHFQCSLSTLHSLNLCNPPGKILNN